MRQEILVGSRIPDVKLAWLENGDIVSRNSHAIFEHHRAVVVGLPGAFTPVCTKQHVPDFVKNAPRLRASGFTELICLVPNDPFALIEWQEALDPKGELTFLSDGNLDFATALGLTTRHTRLFLGWRSERYMMIVENGMITRFRVEPNIITYSCTRPGDAVDAA
jgi:2-Cys peroxiredoxin 5